MNISRKMLLPLLIAALAGCQSTSTDQTAASDAGKTGKREQKAAAISGHGLGEADRKAFIEEHDRDADGRVSRDEYTAFRNARFASADVNGNGLLDENEYVDEYAVRLDRQLESERKGHVTQTLTRFKSLDRNGDGAISWEEYQASGERTWKHWDSHGTGRVLAQEHEQSPRQRTRSVLAMPTSHNIGGFLELYDDDADGVVTRADFDRQRQQVFAATDTDGDGLLSLDEYRLEFENRLDRQAASVRDRQLKQARVRFGVLDGDKDGAISAAEYLATGLRSFERWDTDGDGHVAASDPLPSRESWARQAGAAAEKPAEKTSSAARYQ